MKNGFIKVAAATVEIEVAAVEHNVLKIKELIDKAEGERVSLLVLPELCVTSATCGDLFFSEKLISAARQAVIDLAEYTSDKSVIVVAGAPIMAFGRLYNCAAVLHKGKIAGIAPKELSAADSSLRYFESGSRAIADSLCVNGREIPFGSGLVFEHEKMASFAFGAVVGAPDSVTRSAAERLCKKGAMIIANPAAYPELIGRHVRAEMSVKAFCSENISGYILSNASKSESTGDYVYPGNLMIYEGAAELKAAPAFGDEDMIISEIDVADLSLERSKAGALRTGCPDIKLEGELCDTELTRKIPMNPFVPEDVRELAMRAEQILAIQANGLIKRMNITHSKTAVIGISGGLDSTLALLVVVRAIKLSNRPLKDIIAVTLPCFGTSERTKSNAVRLCEELGIGIKEINISNSVLSHFKDISHPEDCYDVTFENAQARERTQVLMDIANMTGGLVIGTGDLSELALGWATYNGDHMSMYAVNASVPKTLMRHIVCHEAELISGRAGEILRDIVATPVSPELLPADESGNIAQKTEDLVGPYELHDFFIYYTVRKGFSPKKIYALACRAFSGVYAGETILHWLNTFTRRFFTQQFKRSCLPDGPAVGSVSLSPRGAWAMPTDSSYALWLSELKEQEG